MAQSYTSTNGTVYIPGSYVESKVENQNSGFSTTGVVVLVGEADAGPDYTLEKDITANGFGPDDFGSVQAKYGSGQLVDAFKMCISPSSDPNLQGSPFRIFLAKTNPSAKASVILNRNGLADWATVTDSNYGELGNLISLAVTSPKVEVAPTTGQFTYIPQPDASTLALRVNGGSTQTLSLSAFTSPKDFVGTISDGVESGLSGLNDILALGGGNRDVIGNATGTTTLGITAISNNVIITVGGTTTQWANRPSVGDTLVIPNLAQYDATAKSAIAGASNQNLGAYVVTGSTTNTITATKLTHGVSGAFVSPVTVAPTVLASGYTDIVCYSPVTITNYTGMLRGTLTGLVGKTVTGVASGNTLTLTLQTGSVWAGQPMVGDFVYLPPTAPIAWQAADEGGSNVGWYKVSTSRSSVAAGGSYIKLERLTTSEMVAPRSFAATAIAAVSDLKVYKPVIDGFGKSLELFDGAGTANIANSLYNLGVNKVTWVSTAITPKLLTSTSEYSARIVAARKVSGTQDSIDGSGDVVIQVGYSGTGNSDVTATLTISDSTLTTTTSDGNDLSVDLTKYTTLADLVEFINSNQGYTAKLTSGLYAQTLTYYVDADKKKYTVLDMGTFGIASNLGALPGRLKKSAYDLYKSVQNTAKLIQFSAVPNSGLPEVKDRAFLVGGSRGATTNATVTGALNAVKKIRGNFINTLFSQDSTQDIEEGVTSSDSVYDIDSINAALKSHVLEMSAYKRRRPRQGFSSKRTTFEEAKIAAGNLADWRMALAFQDIKTLDSQGTITQFQPWATAVYASAMQAAGFNRAIFKKKMNINGVLMNDDSFSDDLDSDVEDALISGLLTVVKSETGGFEFVSDQTTYGVDDNFVYNSIQAVYALDIINMTIARGLEQKFVSTSIADTNPGIMLGGLKEIMTDIKTNKLTASSPGAELGYRNATIKQDGGVFPVFLEVKLAGAVYFVPVTTYVTKTQQSASQ